MAKVLIAEGADVNARGIRGLTPLHYSAHHGHFNVVELLVEEGADVNAKTKQGQTPYNWRKISATRKSLNCCVITMRRNDGFVGSGQRTNFRLVRK